MTNKTDRTRKSGGSARQGARRGSVYEQIAQARAKREEALSQRGETGVDPSAANTVAALRGKDAPAPLSRKELANPELAPTPPSSTPDRTQQDTEASQDEPERSLEDLVLAAEAMDEVAARRSTGPLWITSLTIAALAFGSVAWFSRPAVVPTEDIAPAIALETEAPNVFADGSVSLSSPDAGEALELALASTAWSGLTVVRPAAPTQPGQDLAAAAPEAIPSATTSPTPRPRPASLDVPLTEDGPIAEDEVLDVAESTVLEEDVSDAAAGQPAEDVPEPVEFRDIRVVLNAPRTVPDASLAAVIEALQQSGANADPRRVNLTISNSNVRYFHSEDAEAAAAIAEGIGARLRDFTDFEPAPPEGLVEIWMAGREVGGATERRDGPLDQLAQDLRQLERDLRRVLRGN